MTHQPFSIAISVYKNDSPEFFDRALESITDLQTVKPDEIVLVIDGPVSDEIDAVIEKYAPRYTFNIIRLKTNGGLGNALKLAIENAKYDLIARMDSDDIAVPNRFELQLAFFNKNPKVDVCGGNISEFIQNENNIIGFRNVPTSNKDIRKFIKKRCPFNHMTVMFKKDSVIKCGGYLDFYFNEDYYLWIRMLLNNSIFSNLPVVLVNVRTGIEQYQRRGGLKYYKSEKKLQKMMLKNGIISCPLFLCNCMKRFIVQVLLPPKLRGYLLRKVARTKK